MIDLDAYAARAGINAHWLSIMKNHVTFTDDIATALKQVAKSVEELGEVSEAIIKRHGKQRTKEELADAILAVLSVAAALHIDGLEDQVVETMTRNTTAVNKFLEEAGGVHVFG